jgi:hypothetical protein
MLAPLAKSLSVQSIALRTLCCTMVSAGMEVVSLEAAQQMRDAGQFLVHQEVLGHIYGITSAAVRKLQAMGKLPLLDLDRVQDVERLRTSGFQVTAMHTAHAQLGCAGTEHPDCNQGHAHRTTCAPPADHQRQHAD